MARLAVLTPLPPVRSDAAMAGASLVRLLRRSSRHDVSAPWPIPESVEALLGVTDLPVYHVTNDPEGREVYELAVERPGLVVLHDLALDRIVRAGLAAHDLVAMDSAREALATFDLLEGLDPGSALRMPWCSYLLRRARGVVVHSSFAARYLRALETRTPVFTAAPPAACDRRALGGSPPEPPAASDAGARAGGRGHRRDRRRNAGIAGRRDTPPGRPGPGLRLRAPEGTPGGVTRVGLPEERDLVAWLAACDG